MAIDPFANCNYDILGWQCTLETCCLAQSSFYYLPNLGGNVFFALFFGLLMFPQAYLGWKYKTWGYASGMILGLAFEVMGYAGRVRLHQNPFDGMGFWIYVIAVTIAPVFLTAAIYLCLARIIVVYGSHNARLAPRTIAIGFMTSDFTSLVLQATGGAITSVSEGYKAGRRGAWIMIAGLILQVVSLGLFLIFCGDMAWTCHRGDVDQLPSQREVRDTQLFRSFGVGILVATVAILVRSIFRVVELWEGFGGKLWNDEVLFMVFDGAMVGFASIILTALHPGPAFKSEWAASNWTFRGRSRRDSRVEEVVQAGQRIEVPKSD